MQLQFSDQKLKIIDFFLWGNVFLGFMLAIFLVVRMDLFETRRTEQVTVTVVASNGCIFVTNSTPWQLFDILRLLDTFDVLLLFRS